MTDLIPPIPPEALPLGDIEMPPGIYNAANRSDVNKATKNQKTREEGKLLALETTLSTKYGRALVFDLLTAAGMWETGVSATYNSNEMWSRLGMRQMAVNLNTLAWRASPHGYKLMLDENNTTI